MAPTYPQSHYVLRWGGWFGNTTMQQDEWSTGLRIGGPAALIYDGAKIQTFVDACWTALVTFHGSSSALVGTNCILSWATAALVGTDGKYLPPTQVTKRHDAVVPIPGSGSGTMPFNTALVISLRTAKPRGYASNGRVYYPMMSVALDQTTGRIDDGVVQERVNAFKTLINSINTAANTLTAGYKVCVFSGVPPGEKEVVTSIRSDGRLDSIERRESAQPVTYSTATIP